MFRSAMVIPNKAPTLMMNADLLEDLSSSRNKPQATTACTVVQLQSHLINM